MRLSISKTYKVNLGNYESLEVGGHVTLDSEVDYDDDELPEDRDEAMAVLLDDAKGYLLDYLEPELRAAVDMGQVGARTFTLDCDVLQADGGTRTASITGGFVAFALALRRLKEKKLISTLPKLTPVAAVSVGIVRGEVLVDLDYVEDSGAEVDLNIVATAEGRLVEVQGTAEHKTFDRAQLNAMLDLGLAAIQKLAQIQEEALRA